MASLAQAFKIRPGEGRVVALQSALMLCVGAGNAAGLAAAEALLFARFGVQALPYLYVGLGVVNFAVALAVTVLLGLIPRDRYYLGVPPVMLAILLAARGGLALGAEAVYPVLWIVTQVMISVQGQMTWGLAGTVVDGRQARRLFPLFTAGAILGMVLGGFGARFFVAVLPVENLLVVWALAVAAVYGLARTLLRARPVKPAAGPSRRPAVIQEVLQGFRFVRASPLLRWMSFAIGQFMLLMFLVAFPFSQAAAAEFPDAASLASFLATFQSVATGAALVLSLFVANRLFARFGLTSMVLVFTLVFVVGFVLLIVAAAFPTLVLFRLAAMAWLQGVALTAWQAIFGVVPPDRRDRVRSFNVGVPGQLGTVVAGLILLLGGSALDPRIFYAIGLVVALGCSYAVWRIHRAYGTALVEALRSGWPHVFYDEDEPFGGMLRDASAVNTAIAGLASPEASVRRVAAEVLANFAEPRSQAALFAALADPEPDVRAAVARALGAQRVASAAPALARLLVDGDPTVRAAALAALDRVVADGDRLAGLVRARLADDDGAVKALAAGILLRRTHEAAAEGVLTEMALRGDGGARALAVAALGASERPIAFDLVAPALLDPAPAVRRAAAEAMARLSAERALDGLVEALGDEDRTVREAVGAALELIGPPALPQLVAALKDRTLEEGALGALGRLPAESVREALMAYGHDEVEAALAYRELAGGFVGGTDEREQLLMRALRDAAERHARHALMAVGLLADRASIGLALERIGSRDPREQGSAIEALEVVAPRIVRPVLRVWEPPVEHADRERALLAALNDGDGWVRACAALAAGGTGGSEARARLAELAADPDPFVRATAADPSLEEKPMDTIATLSPMERVLFLRGVGLFADLPPGDLKHIAAAASEQHYADGATLMSQGEAGDAMLVIVAGEVRVLVGAEGASREVARRRRGDCVGEMAIISHEPRSATLVADGDVRVLSIDQRRFEAILRERPETGLAVMRELCARLAAAHAGQPAPVATTPG